MDDKMDSRRKFLKKAAYVAPIVVTLQAVPSFASSGSGFGGTFPGGGNTGGVFPGGGNTGGVFPGRGPSGNKPSD
jgi:hypothetical protein